MITLHHLRIGRSVFTAWLLEELNLEYQLEIYVRDANRRAPPELRNIHPLGKSPVIDDDGLIIAESTAIALHLVEQYGKDSTLAPPSQMAANSQWMQWLLYPEGSAFAPMLITLLLATSPEDPPPRLAGFAAGEVKLHLDYIDNQLGNQSFLLGEVLQLPDIGVTYIVEMANRLGLLKVYPRLAAYLERNQSRPAFQRALERTGG